MHKRDLEIKFQATEEGLISGYASVFGGTPDSHGDVITSGAFQASLAEHKAAGTQPLMLWAHDQTKPIGKWLSIKEDSQGLSVSGQINLETQAGREAYALLKSRAFDGLSIGYRVTDFERRSPRGRTLKSIDLQEISLVTLPSNKGTRITDVKSALAVTPASTAQHMEAQLSTQPTDAAPEAETKDIDLSVFEEKQAAFDDRLSGLEGSVETITKTSQRIEQKLNRPGLSLETEKPGEIEAKAFTHYLKSGLETKDLDKATSGGGFLAPTQFGNEIIKNLIQFSPVRQYARITNIGGSEYKTPKRTGTMTAAWVAEKAARSETQPTYDDVTLTPYEIACYVDVSNQLLEDNQYNLVNELSLDFAEEFGRLEGSAFINGDGSGKPSGILTDTDIPQVAGGHASQLQADALIDLFHALPSFYAANGAWGMNRTTIGAVRKLKDSNGRYLWTDPVSEGNPPSILGRPVVEMVDMPDVAANSLAVMFGDLNQGYRIVDRVSLSVMRDPYSIATTGQTRFHARRRVGGSVVKPEALRILKIATSVS